MAPKFLIVDLFCGAGGTTTGFEMTNGIAKVIACVNHDPIAIKSHWANHPDVHHFEEDIRTLDLTELSQIVANYRVIYPDAKLILWASLECTNFSKARGGLPRDADSRTLACHLYRYIETLNPDYIEIENVVEFMAWGPLDDNGKPLSRKNGADWLKWREHIREYGYHDDWKEMNSANYGSYTSRNRLFGCFAKYGLPIAWPQPTHSKKVSDGMFGSLKPWKAVKDVLDFSDEGRSIFNRDKPLSEKTMERIYAGLVKFVAGGEKNFLAKIYAVASNSDGVYSTNSTAHTITTRDAHTLISTHFITKYFSGRPAGKNISVEGPAGTIKTIDGQALVKTSFIHAYYSSGDNNHSTDKVAPTLRTRDGAALVQAKFLLNYNHSSKSNSLFSPAPTLVTRDKLSLVTPHFIMRDFTNGGGAQSIDKPAGALMTIPKMNIVTVTKNFLINPSWFGSPLSTDDPCPVIVARQDKAPLYLIATSEGEYAIPVFPEDSEQTKLIKAFMVLFGISDIKMRMLKVSELLRIQGFPAGYKLEGSQADQKKFIGNSVEPNVVKAWTLAMAEEFPAEEAMVA